MKKPSSAFLKFIIIYKALIGVVQLVITVGIFNVLDHTVEATITNLAASFYLDTENAIVVSIIKKVGGLGNPAFIGITSAVFALSIINLAEAWGLHLRKRWAEWLTVIATGIFIPVEVYEVIMKVTPTRVFILLLNSAIVYYLAKHKELFSKKAAKHRHGL